VIYSGGKKISGGEERGKELLGLPAGKSCRIVRWPIKNHMKEKKEEKKVQEDEKGNGNPINLVGTYH